MKMYGIQDGNSSIFFVGHLVVGEEFNCMCRMFQRMGLVCRHMFIVFKNLGLKKIPSKYVLSRWTKLAILSLVFTIDDTVVKQCLVTEERERESLL